MSDALEQPARESTPRKGGLGRGLGSLIPTAPPPTESGATVEISIDAIEPNPYQPRTILDSSALDALAQSIKTHGIIQPLVVANGPERGRYVLIAGERRWRASRIAGLTTVPVVIKDAAPRAMLELALVENVVRADLSPLEEAAAYRQLIDDFNLTQAAVAERVGRSRVSVTNTLRLLSAPDAVQSALANNEISEGHARALLGLPSTVDQMAALDVVLEKGLSVRQTEDLVRRWDPTKAKVINIADRRTLDPHFADVQTRLERSLGTKVTLQPSKDGSGRVTIHFGSEEELSALTRRLAGESDW